MQHSTTAIFWDLSFEITCNSQNTCQPKNNCCSLAQKCLDVQGSIQTGRQNRGWLHWWGFHPLPLFELISRGAQNGSGRGDTRAARTSTPLGSSLCNQKVSFIKLARLTFDPLENFRFCNTQQSCWTFQHFKMNLNIDLSLASTPRESFARVQGPSHWTATLPALDKLRTNCRFIWVPKCCCQKVCADLRHSGKSTMILNGKTTISAEPENPIKDP